MSKTAIVTGAARGIGKAIALRLAKMGYNVVINYASDSSTPKAAAVAEEAKAFGVDAITIKADVSKYEEWEKIAAATVEKFGADSIKVLVNNAGVCTFGHYIEADPSAYVRHVEVNLIGTMHGCRVIAPYLVANGGGDIINVASVASIMPVANQPGYCASKAGVLGLTKELALEWGKSGIKVNAICPGQTATDMLAGATEEAIAAMLETVPLGIIGSPEDQADCVEFFINNRFTTGQYISPNGGLRM